MRPIAWFLWACACESLMKHLVARPMGIVRHEIFSRTSDGDCAAAAALWGHLPAERRATKWDTVP